MQTLGQKISIEEIDEVFRIHNPRIKDEISYIEFKNIVLSDV
jgi:hypothetical protein